MESNRNPIQNPIGNLFRIQYKNYAESDKNSMEKLQSIGFATAWTSYSKNGLAVMQGFATLPTLRADFDYLNLPSATPQH